MLSPSLDVVASALQSAKMSADVRAKKSQDLQKRQSAFQMKMHERQTMIQGGGMAARKYFFAQVDAVVHAIMTERGADVVLDKSAVVDSASCFNWSGVGCTNLRRERCRSRALSNKRRATRRSMATTSAEFSSCWFGMRNSPA